MSTIKCNSANLHVIGVKTDFILNVLRLSNVAFLNSGENIYICNRTFK